MMDVRRKADRDEFCERSGYYLDAPHCRALLDYIDELEQMRSAVIQHLVAIAGSPSSMGWSDIEHLEAALELLRDSVAKSVGEKPVDETPD